MGMFELASQAKLMYAHFQCLATGPDFTPASQMNQKVVFDMSELKTKVGIFSRIA